MNCSKQLLLQSEMEYLETYAKESTDPLIVSAILKDDVGKLSNILWSSMKDNNCVINFKQIPEFPLKILSRGSPLISISTLFGSIQCLSYLLLTGVSIDSPDSIKCSPIFYAIASSRLDFVIFLINNGADVNVLDSYGCNLLHYCARYDQYDIAKYLIETVKMDISKANSRDSTPLMWAAMFGSIPILKLYLAHDPNPTRTTKGGWNALHYSIKQGQQNVLSYLVSINIFDIDAEIKSGTTALNLAINENLVDIIDILMSKGCSLIPKSLYSDKDNENTDNENEITMKNPLTLAIQTNKSENVQKLLTYQRVIESLNSDVLEACFDFICVKKETKKKTKKAQNDIDNITFNVNTYNLFCLIDLVNHFPNLCPKSGIPSFLYKMIRSNCNVDAVKVFFDNYKIDPNWENIDDSGKTFLFPAISCSNIEVIQYLVYDMKANPNVMDKSSCSPLYYAILSKNVNVCKILLSLENINLTSPYLPYFGTQFFESNTELLNLFRSRINV